MPPSRYETVRLGEAPQSLERNDGALVCHVNLARGYRGGERQTELLIRGLAQWRIRQRLIARRGEPLAARLENFAELDVRTVGNSPLGVVRHARGATLLHVHEGRSVHAASLNRILRHTPYVITRRVDNPIRNTIATRRAYRGATAVAAVSQAVMEQVAALDQRIVCRIVPDASSALHSFPASAKRIRERFPGRFLVGNVAALVHEHKGQMDIIATARELQRTHPQVQFVLVGDGVDEGRMRAAAKDLNNVHFTGFVDNVGDYLAAFDAFVYPSLHEGLGSVLLDAMEFDLPIVATRVGGIADIVRDGDNGLLVQPGNPDQLRFAVLRLLKDKALAQRLGQRGKEIVQDYSADRMTERYLDLYRPLLDAANAIENL